MKIQDLNHLKILANKYTSIYDVCKIVRREALYGDNKSLSLSLLNNTIPDIRNNIISRYITNNNIKEEIVSDIREAKSLIDLKFIVREEESLKDLNTLLLIENNLKMEENT